MIYLLKTNLKITITIFRKKTENKLLNNYYILYIRLVK